MRAIFVQIKCEMGQSYKVAREAADTIEQMSELYSTSGQYDLLGKFYLEPEQDIGLFITEKIQMLPGVKDTYTLITFNAFSWRSGLKLFIRHAGAGGHTNWPCRAVMGFALLNPIVVVVVVGWVEQSETHRSVIPIDARSGRSPPAPHAPVP